MKMTILLGLVFILSLSVAGQEEKEKPLVKEPMPVLDATEHPQDPRKPLEQTNPDAETWQKTSSEWEKNMPSMDEEKSKQISRYFEEALKNYEDILENQKDSEVKTTEKRIENNIRILEEYQKNLGTSETTLRKVKLEYMRRFLVLKNSFSQNRIDKATYEKELQKMAQEYSYKVSSLTSDRNFYQTEAKKASERLKALEELNRINKIILTHEKGTPEESEPPRQLTEIEKLLEGIREIGCFEAKDFCHSPEFK